MCETRYEPLGCGYGVFISAEHGFGTDALILASFAAPRKSDVACDLGSGCGIIPAVWCRDSLCSHITAVEISKSACEQLECALDKTPLGEKVTVINADLRALKGVVEFNCFDLVTMNPPYKAVDTGKTSANEAHLIARHEVMCGIDDITKVASKLLKPGGRLCLCNRPERLCDMLCAMRSAGIEPKRLRFAAKDDTKAPWLVLVEGKKGSKPFMRVEPTLFMKNADGSDTDEIIKIYGAYKN